jgi:hypothetical protein
LDNIESNKYTFDYNWGNYMNPKTIEFTRWIGEYTIGQIDNIGRTLLWFKPNVADALWGELEEYGGREHYYELLKKGKPVNYNNLRGKSLDIIINESCGYSREMTCCIYRNIFEFNNYLNFCDLKLRKKIKNYDMSKCVFLESFSNGNFGPCLWIISDFDKVEKELKEVLKDVENIDNLL